MVHSYCGSRPTTADWDYDVPKKKPTAQETSRWTFRGKMTLATAQRIFGFSGSLTAQELLARWRHLIWEHHPDHGGDTDIAAAINAAYSFLKPICY